METVRTIQEVLRKIDIAIETAGRVQRQAEKAERTMAAEDYKAALDEMNRASAIFNDILNH